MSEGYHHRVITELAIIPILWEEGKEDVMQRWQLEGVC